MNNSEVLEKLNNISDSLGTISLTHLFIIIYLLILILEKAMMYLFGFPTHRVRVSGAIQSLPVSGEMNV